VIQVEREVDPFYLPSPNASQSEHSHLDSTVEALVNVRVALATPLFPIAYVVDENVLEAFKDEVQGFLDFFWDVLFVLPVFFNYLGAIEEDVLVRFPSWLVVASPLDSVLNSLTSPPRLQDAVNLVPLALLRGGGLARGNVVLRHELLAEAALGRKDFLFDLYGITVLTQNHRGILFSID